MKKLFIKKNNLFLCIAIIFETIVIKFLQYKILPEKYFYDSKKILAIMNGSTITDKGFSFTANFFKAVNIFNLNNIKQWSFILSILFLIIFVIYFLKKELSITKIIYIFASFALLNIYVFNLSKDVIQLLFFMLTFYVCKKVKNNDNKKVFIVSLIFLIESCFFRTYYLIISILTIGIYYIYKFCFYNKKQNKKRTSLIIFFVFSLFMFMIYVLQKISIDNYMILINARSKSNIYRNATDAVTMINDIFSNNNYFYFIVNYIINTIRILFPIELFTKGIKYVPFIFYQCSFSYILIKNLKNITQQKSIYIFVILAFVMTSIIYEPDFGSVIRHESVLMLFVLEIMGKEREKKNEKSISNNTNLQTL